ncbi:MAG: TonB-dependent receptor [Blastocatellia bacterium]|nr:TonB-dependent receptor [Blastocatellia bacterium]
MFLFPSFLCLNPRFRLGMPNRAFSLVVLLVVSCGVGFSQNQKNVLTGRVLDDSGATIGGAKVRLIQKTIGFEKTVLTDGSGLFVFEQVQPNDYVLTVMADHFAPSRQQVSVKEGTTATSIEVMLHPGTFSQDITEVTARIAGNPETIERIPGAVEILDQKTLESSRLFNFNEALRKVTGLNVREEEGFGLRPNIGIRGLNPTRSTKVLLLEDGIPLTYAPYGDNASYYHPPVERYESIEVLKGSGQIVYGPVTVGGVLNYVTPMPPGKRSGTVTLTGGNRDYFNGNINYGWNWRNTGFYFDYLRKQGEGARVNIRHGLNDLLFKSVTTFNSRNSLTLKGNFFNEDSQVTYSGLRLDEYLKDPRSNPFLNDRLDFKRLGFSATHSALLTDQLVLSTSFYVQGFFRDWWRQASNSGQRPNDAADPKCGGIANLYTTCGNEGRLRDYSTVGVAPQFRFSHRLFGIRNEADFGVRLHFEKQDREQQNGDTPTARSGLVVERNIRNNQAYSGFIQNRFILGNLTISPGLRIERVLFERTNRLANNGAGVTGRTDLTQVIPGLGVSYNFKNNLTVFAGVHRGFAPPRTEDVVSNTGGVVDLEPELSWNYEAGFRSLPTPGVRLEASYFRMDYENQIIAASLAGGVGATLTNGGKTLHQGGELSGRLDSGTLFKSAHNVYVRGNLTFVKDAKFVGTRFSNVAGFTTVQVTGNRLPYAPETLATVGFGYSYSKGVEVFAEAVHTGDQFGDDLNTVVSSADGQRGLIPASTIWNATLNYRAEALRTTFFVTCKNLLDDTFIVDRARGILPSSPRLIQAGLKYRF